MWKKYFSKTLNFEIGGDRAENVFCRALNFLKVSYLKHLIIWCSLNNINKDSPFDIAECLIEIGKYFQERSLVVKVVISGIRFRGECWSVSRIIITEIFNNVADRWSLRRFYFIDQKYGWTSKNGMLNANLCFKDNVSFIEQGNAKLASSVLAAMSNNITSSARGISVNTN